MRPTTSAIALTAAVLFVIGTTTAQTKPPADECQAQRQRLAQHAELSGGVRKLLAAVPTSPAPASAPAATPSASSRADAIRARLAQIPPARELLEAQRLNAAEVLRDVLDL